jgi:hypothetical protein
VYQKEVHLLKQVESLNKNQEEKKVMQVANSIQIKLAAKKKEIEELKLKLVSTETNLESLSKVKLVCKYFLFRIDKKRKNEYFLLNFIIFKLHLQICGYKI